MTPNSVAGPALPVTTVTSEFHAHIRPDANGATHRLFSSHDSLVHMTQSARSSCLHLVKPNEMEQTLAQSLHSSLESNLSRNLSKRPI